MYLLEHNSAGQPRLTEDFADCDIPKYTILSHTWGADTQEVTFQDLNNNAGSNKAGYKKIYFCGKQANRDGLRYFWYQNATKCYVYLSDVLGNDHDQINPSLQSRELAFSKSRWFTRGWTLQELIAPQSVEFFDFHEIRLGDKKSLEQQLSEITGIAVSIFRGTPLSAFGAKDKMSWTKNRQTKLPEDRAYSMLGIFDVSMPLIYGEGAEKAFQRLHDELYKHSKKRHSHELSWISDSFYSTKRLKPELGQDSSTFSRRVPELVCHELILSPEYALKIDTVSCLDDVTIKITQHTASDHRNMCRVSGPEDDEDKNVAGALTHAKEACTTMNQVHGKGFLNTPQRRKYLASLKFDEINDHRETIKVAHDETCQWLLDTSEYRDWLEVEKFTEHHGSFWIKGNPATGKSTIMKFVYENAMKTITDTTIIAFFFNARGQDLEKSGLGMYRSLLVQLLESLPELQYAFDSLKPRSEDAGSSRPWDIETVRALFGMAVKGLGQHSLICFIDALDECEDSEARAVVEFFEYLGEFAVSSHTRFLVCFSSRPYPEITVGKCIQLELENRDGHRQDIASYLNSKLKVRRSKDVDRIKKVILEKASGIFLWVKLVVDILNEEYRNRRILTLQKRLNEIPEGLEDLFSEILTRDCRNIDEMILCLQLILYAKRPLRCEELYFAHYAGNDSESLTPWNHEQVTRQDMERFVRTFSKGLASVKKYKN
ncbi:hypothetical protein B7463_g9425, partial [Scytalidium lignicola]